MHYKEINANDFVDICRQPMSLDNDEMFSLICSAQEEFKLSEKLIANELVRKHVLPNGFLRWKKVWIKNRMLHRLDGPAIISEEGQEAWFKDGEPHRINGPAVTLKGGTRSWFQNGHLHRLDGPAILTISGYEDWRLNGTKYSKEEWFEQLTKEQLAVALANPENF